MPPRNTSFGAFSEVLKVIQCLHFDLFVPSQPARNQRSLANARQEILNYGFAVNDENNGGFVIVPPGDITQNVEALITIEACKKMLPPELRPSARVSTWKEFEAHCAPFIELSPTHTQDTFKAGLKFSLLRDMLWVQALLYLKQLITDALPATPLPRDLIEAFEFILGIFAADVQQVFRSFGTENRTKSREGLNAWLDGLSALYPARSFASLLKSSTAPASSGSMPGSSRVHHVAAVDLRQCFNCFQPGHLASVCPNPHLAAIMEQLAAALHDPVFRQYIADFPGFARQASSQRASSQRNSASAAPASTRAGGASAINLPTPRFPSRRGPSSPATLVHLLNHFVDSAEEPDLPPLAAEEEELEVNAEAPGVSSLNDAGEHD